MTELFVITMMKRYFEITEAEMSCWWQTVSVCWTGDSMSFFQFLGSRVHISITIICEIRDGKIINSSIWYYLFPLLQILPHCLFHPFLIRPILVTPAESSFDAFGFQTSYYMTLSLNSQTFLFTSLVNYIYHLKLLSSGFHLFFVL